MNKAFFFCCVVFLTCVSYAQTQRPNILFIFTDDHATNGIGAYGGRFASLNPTPTIDRLAREGVLLHHVFVTNSICTPSRATLMTGQYSHTNGIKTLIGSLTAERQTLANEMKKAGYETALVGKWHLDAEPAAFDYYTVLPDQGSYFNPIFLERGANAYPNNVARVASYDSVHSEDAITDRSLRWLKERKEKSKPFFLMHHFKSPHDNFENAERYDFLYENVTMPEPESLWKRGNHGPVGQPQFGTSVGKRNTRRNMGQHMFVDGKLDDEQYKRTAYQRYMKKYFRCVKGLDDNIARLLTHLEQTGELDNTIIIYTSDQGFMLGEHDYIDKRWMYDESLRTPFIVRYPKLFKAGRVNDDIINNVDFAPTILELAGVKELPKQFQGRSFVSNLLGKTPSDWPTATYYRYWMNMAHHDNPAHYGIRTKTHKLIFFYGLPLDAKGALDTKTPAWLELYDLRKDPQEMNNVVTDPAYAETLAQLKAQLVSLKQRVGDTDEKYPDLLSVRERLWR
ncbi:MAG: sulfatase [Acidobacteria bacterium]|nr:sulfatase [Acidobacteriota bacterium]